MPTTDAEVTYNHSINLLVPECRASTDKEIIRSFIDATHRWMEYVGKDHHKDRDCHWDITKKYSYGYDYYPYQLNWYCLHQGYIAGEQLFEGMNEEEVMKKIIVFINKFMQENPEQSFDDEEFASSCSIDNPECEACQ